MIDISSKSAILVYQSTCATNLKGAIINFLEIDGFPIIYSVLSTDILSIYTINVNFTLNSFLTEIFEISSNFEAPFYIFQYDLACFKKFKNFQYDLCSYFTRYDHVIVDDNKYFDLEDFYSYTLPECFGSFFTYSMYLRFSQTGDFTEISNFVRSIMFSKLILLIDKFSKFSIIKNSYSTISISVQGNSIVSLPETSCIIDMQTTGLDKDSSIILFTIFRKNSFTTYFLDDLSSEGKKLFQEFIVHSIDSFDIVYVFNINFESIFFPEFKKFVDLKFNKYHFWATARKIVHLPYYHLEFDPGSGKNVPIWYKLLLLEPEDRWRDLLVRRAIVNVLTKVSILASTEKSPFSDHIICDLRKIRPTYEFTNQFSNQRCNLLKKKIKFYPVEYNNTYLFDDGQYSEMYLHENLLSDEKE